MLKNLNFILTVDGVPFTGYSVFVTVWSEVGAVVFSGPMVPSSSDAPLLTQQVDLPEGTYLVRSLS